MQENSPKKITIPDSVKTIERHAFSYCTSLEEVIIPEGVETIGRGAFGGCESLRQIDVDINNGEYKSKDGNLYSKDGKVLIRYAQGKLEESFKILPCVETIGEDAFMDCESLKRVTIPGSVKRIESGAFRGCNLLRIVYYGGTQEQWGKKAFAHSINLRDARKYFYSETRPEESGDYWHFGKDGKTPVIW